MTACGAASSTPPAVSSPTNAFHPTGINLAGKRIATTPSATPTVTQPPAAATATQTATPSRTKNPHKYVFPVQPQEKADFAEGGHAYPATDIFTDVGSDFVAVTAGVVDFVRYKDIWDPVTDDPAVAGGLCVAIIGDDGVRYYGSHLSEIAVGIRPGARVEAGQLLGLTGTSGNARDTTPHLHFGISHPTYPEDWKTRRGELDPYPYLVAWSRGEEVTPRFPTPTLTLAA
ncbi:MAG: M23 family metallopeptidase [Anaerolineales bacterium]|nr:M23 family metallopeptidase [Anaerolineales bacterium]